MVNGRLSNRDQAPKRISFRIRAQYFDKILRGEKREEIRSDTPFWRRRLLDDLPQIAIFICGKRVHRRRITRIHVEDNPIKVLGRPFSERAQGYYDEDLHRHRVGRRIR